MTMSQNYAEEYSVTTTRETRSLMMSLIFQEPGAPCPEIPGFIPPNPEQTPAHIKHRGAWILQQLLRYLTTSKKKSNMEMS